VCNGLLKNEEVGTFIIRFSESYPGLFAIAYVDDDPYEKYTLNKKQNSQRSVFLTPSSFLHVGSNTT